MKKIYLVKKDVTKPTGENNWIIMTGKDFMEFVKTEEGRLRAKKMGRLNGYENEDTIIYAECGEACAREWKKDQNREDYIKRRNDESEITVIPCSELYNCNDNYDCNDTFVDEFDLEYSVIKKDEIECLHLAIKQLNPYDREIIMDMYLNYEGMSEREYAKIKGMNPKTLHVHKSRAIERLRKILEIPKKKY